MAMASVRADETKAKIAVDVAIASQKAAQDATPELPDDFNGRGDRTVKWAPEGGSSRVVTSQLKTTEKWLVSEPWCAYCPAAKKRFIEAGNPEDHVITIAKAKELHGRSINGVPAEYTTEATIQIKQPPSYRRQWPPKWDVQGDATPNKNVLLKHLRTHENHSGKHWSEWYLESWEKEQLAALHDDDHDNKVPTYDEPTAVEATPDGPVNSKLIAATLVEHVQRHRNGDVQVSSGILPTIPLDLPDEFLALLDGMISGGASPASGVKLKWPDGERSIAFSPNIEITLRKVVELDIAIDKITVDDRTLTIGVVKPALCPDLKVRLK